MLSYCIECVVAMSSSQRVNRGRACIVANGDYSVLYQTRRNTVHIKCAFNYSDNLVIINQVTPVTIQNKNHLEIIQIRTQIKLVIW